MTRAREAGVHDGAHTDPRSHHPRNPITMAFKLTTLAASLALVGLAGGALAQSTPERITITGSSIKRIATEGALPVQVITRAELDNAGVTTAEQFLLDLAANGTGLDNLASNADVVAGVGVRGNNGVSAANLRLQGSNATLILLNGRRIAAHGLSGGQVDLNQIPMSAVERIEILKDGASAIYGTDAVGGVINFILRTNFTGLQLRATADVTQEGGGNIYSGAVTGGFGNLDTDRFNVLAALSYRDAQVLRGDQRDFVNSFQPNRGLSVDTRGTPFATLFPLADPAGSTTRVGLFRNAADTPFVPGSTTVRASGGLNVLDLPGGPGCDAIPGMAPYSDQLWNNPNAALACSWDTGRAAVIQQPIKTTTFVGRGSLRLGEHVLSAELLASNNKSAKRFSNIQLSANTTNLQLRFPRNADSQAAYDAVFDRLLAAFPGQILPSQRGQTLSYRWRCVDCGPREIETDTDTRRVFIGSEGPLLAGWDYRTGAMQATSQSKSRLGSGYYYRGTLPNGTPDGRFGLLQALNTGIINPFALPGQGQSAQALALLERASARGVTLYGGKYTVEGADFTASGPVFKLPGGDAMAAVGLDYRVEKYRFSGDERDVTQRQTIILAPFDDPNVLSGVKRDVKAVFAELILPVFKGVEATFAVRRDEYSGFGSTTNPKVSGVWKPLPQVLVRGSYGTGFRVPTFNQIYNPATDAPSGVDRVDPATCPGLVVNPAVPGCAAIRPDTRSGGRESLGPEESVNRSVGFILEPVPDFSIGVDWWHIKREGTIQQFGVEALMRDYAIFQDRFIRDATGQIRVIDTTLINAGETETEGVDVSVRAAVNAAGARFTGSLEGTYLIKKRSRVTPTASFGPSEVGRFTFSGDLGIRWKHQASVTGRYGVWSSTVSQAYRRGYYDQVLPGVATGTVAPPDWKDRVYSLTTYNLSVSWSGIKGLTVTGLVKNLFDTDPPFAVTYSSDLGSGSSWEPRVADPRGRAFVLTAEYRF